MESIGEIWRRAQFFFQRRQLERELEEEMQFHLEMKAQSNREDGMRPAEALDTARRQFGNATLVREDSRAAWTWSAAERFAKDVRISLRMLRKDLSFTGLAVLTLGLGIGATTAVFSVINGVLLNPLPYKDPGRLVILRQVRTESGVIRAATSYPNFADWKNQSDSFEAIAAQSVPTAITLTEPEPDVVPAIGVDRNFFNLVGVQTTQGRVFAADDFKPGSAPVGIVTWKAWKRRFGSDPGIIGRKLMSNGRARTIIGVLPPQYRQPRLDAEGKDPELLIPMDFSMLRMREVGILNVIGRLKPGVSIGRARSEMAGIGARLAREYRVNQGTEVETVPLADVLVGRVRKPLWLLLGAVLVLLLCACVNMANLLLSRSVKRQQEFAIRAALGGRPGLLFTQVITEGLVLSGLGALAGIALARAGVGWLMFTAGNLIPRGEQVAVDGTVLLFTLALSCLTGLLFACVPAFVCSRGDLNEALKQGGKAAGTPTLGRMRSLLVGAEVVLAVVLLAGAGLLLRSFWRVLNIDMGYETRNVLTADLALPGTENNRGVTLLSALLSRISRLPGVEAAGAAGTVPLALSTTPELSFEIVNSPGTASGEPRSAAVVAADAGYFRAMRIALRLGRLFDAGDGSQSPPVALVNEALVRRYFPGEDPIGRVLNIGAATRNIASGAARIVGIVADVRQTGVLAEAKPQIWRPHAQCQWPFMTLALRTSGDPNALAGPLRSEVRALDRTIPLTNVRTAENYYSEALVERRLSVFLLGSLAALALALSAIGVYGIIAYSVSQRRREIGIRMALGAQPGAVVSMLVGQGLVVALAGLAIGIAAALAVTRLLAGVLYGIAPHDVLTFGGVAVLFAAVAVAASYFPGRRAVRANPLAALRME